LAFARRAKPLFSEQALHLFAVRPSEQSENVQARDAALSRAPNLLAADQPVIHVRNRTQFDLSIYFSLSLDGAGCRQKSLTHRPQRRDTTFERDATESNQ
jgi:hypothetical protein